MILSMEFEEIKRRVGELMELDEGWDGEEAFSVSGPTVRNCLALLEHEEGWI